MSDTQTSTESNGKVRWASLVVSVVIAAGAMTVQWGVVTTKLQQVEKRLDEFISEAHALRTEYQEMERRLSYLEGKINGGKGGTNP